MTPIATPPSLTPQAYTEGVIAHGLGIPIANLGIGTIAFWLKQGKSPAWIAREVFSITVSTES